MKKIKLSVAALLIAGMSYGNENVVKETDTIKAKNELILIMKNGVFISKDEVYDMIATLDEMIDWFREDENNGDYSHGSYEEGWGHVYWITIMRDKLEEIASRNAENWR